MKTGYNNRIDALEQEYEASLTDILVQVYREEQSIAGVAIRLGVSKSTISNWIVRCGLVIESKMSPWYVTKKGQEILAQQAVGQGDNNHAD